MAAAEAPADFDPYGTQGETPTPQESDQTPAGESPPTPAPEPEPEPQGAPPEQGALTPKRKEAEARSHRKEPAPEHKGFGPGGPKFHPTDAPGFFGGLKSDAESTPSAGVAPAEEPGFFNGTPDQPEAPPAAPAPPERSTSDRVLGALRSSVVSGLDETAQAIMTTLTTPGMAFDALHTQLAGIEHTEAQDWWFKHAVDPIAAEKASNELPPDATFAEKGTYAIGSMANMIFQSIAMPEAEIGQAANWAVRFARNSAKFITPNAAQAATVGQSVLDKTGDKAAALEAAGASLVTSSILAGTPMSVGGKIANPALRAGARVGSGAAVGAGMTEVQHDVANATLPESMKTERDPLDYVIGGGIGALFGGYEHVAHGRPVVEAGPANAAERAQTHAAEAAKAEGADALGQVVAATHANAVIGGVHDAAAVQGAREARQQAAAQSMADEAALEEQGQREQALNKVEAAKAPETTPEQGFAQREQEAAQQKEKDYTAARNQQGEQAVEASKTEEIGVKKGGALEPKATLAEALPPEQLAALQGLKARRAAEAAKTEPAPEPTVAERLEAQNPEDNFQKLGPEAPVKAPTPVEGAIKGAQEPVAPAEEEEPPVKGPAPVTAQTLAERRQAALDAKMAEKVRGEEPKPVTAVPERVETAPEVPNRLAAIRAAAEKRNLPVPEVRESTPVPETEPTVESKEVAGIPVAVQTPEGEPRASGAVPEGGDYGFIKGTVGGDGQAVDTITGKDSSSKRAWVVDHLDKDGNWSQHKVLMGFDSELAARRAYRSLYPDNPMGRISGVSTDRLKSWLAKGDTTKPFSPIEKPSTFAERRNQPENEWMTEKGAVHTAADVDRMLRPEMSHDEAREHLSPISDAVGPRSLAVHESHNDDAVPEHLKVQIDNYEAKHPGAKIKGVYDPSTGTAHVFADAHKAGEKDDILSTTTHELTHKGVEAALGPEGGKKYRSVLGGIANEIRDTQWAKTLIKRRGLDLRSPDHLAHLGNEYVAHMAENVAAGRPVHEGLPVVDRVASHWQRIVDTVRQALRSLGLVRHWTDADVAAFIRQAQSHVIEPGALASERAGAAWRTEGDRPLFSVEHEDEEFSRLPPDHPQAQAYKIGRTFEEQGKFNKGSMADLGRAMQSLGEDARNPEHLLGGLGLRNIPDSMPKEKMPNLHGFIQTHDAMEGRRHQLERPDVEFAKKWAKWKAGQDDRGEALDDLISAANIHGQDPSKPYESRHTQAEREADTGKATADIAARGAHKSLAEDYNKLDPEGKAIFKSLPENYEGKRQRTMNAIEDRINATSAPAKTKSNALSALRQAFERGKVKGFYSPMMRYGDWWARAKNPDGTHAAFIRAESKAQRDKWIDEMRKQGFDQQSQIEGGKKFSAKSMMEKVDPEFMRNVMDVVKEADPSGTLAEDIWNEYLKAMPEMSMRKRMITRLGRLGFSGDHLRAFAFNAHHGALQQARLEYGHRLDEHIDGINKESEALGQKGIDNPDDKQAQSDAVWGPAIAQEMQRRYDWIRNPRATKLASNLTKLGFNWFLGMAPATAFRIWTQNPMLAQPRLAKQFGEIGATKELSAASWQWARSRDWMPNSSFGDTLRGDERRAYDEASDRGVFTDTATQAMASGGQGEPMFRGAWYQYQRVAGYMFNALERHNRITTHIAAYRLGIKQKMSHDEASQNARAATWDAHFDYTNANRPRYLQSSGMKVAGLFKQYSLGVTYRMTREFNDMIRADKPADRMAAAHAFAGMMGRMMLFAGVTGVGGVYGLPIYSMVSGIVNKVNNWRDPEHHHDMTAEMHKHLADTMGTTTADSIMTGPIGALTGASLSTGASYNDLWYRPPGRDENPEQTVYDGLGQAAGALASIPLNMARGAGMMAQGNYERGLEHFMPPEGAALMKAYRYATEGALNLKGQSVLPNNEAINKWDVFRQAVGFTPQKVADSYRSNSAKMNEKKDMDQRKNDLEQGLEAAISVGHEKDIKELVGEIEKWNEANPTLAINGRAIAMGVRRSATNDATAVQGLNLPKGYQYLNEKY